MEYDTVVYDTAGQDIKRRGATQGGSLSPDIILTRIV